MNLIEIKDPTTDFLSFKLSDKFVDGYVDRESPFGFKDAGGNSLGEIVFLDKYSRLKPDGTKERWHEVCRRVIEGMYSIQKDWVKGGALPWNDNKAARSAEEAYDLLWNLMWAPPGRGLWSMGTYVVNGLKNSTPLQNCAFISTNEMTKADPAAPFCFLMDVSMLGVGVGYDTLGADKGFVVHQPDPAFGPEIFTVPDSREGWEEAVRKKINSYLVDARREVALDTSLIRPEGAPIKTFGGTAPGPAPLEHLMNQIDRVLGGRDGEVFDVKDIADLMNLIGVCVVSGNVRRSATIALGKYGDKTFMNLKNAAVYPERNSYDPNDPGWGWMSNNSVLATPGQSYDQIIDGITTNGEPGVLWMDNVKGFGRIADGENKDDHRVMGVNPCAEQFLESGEMCTLADLHFSRIPNMAKLRRAIKYAFLYAKTVTLLPTHLPKTNAIMQRNRRIGLSVSGVADFMDTHGRATLRTRLDTGYRFVLEYDKTYSEWLCIRESIRSTTVKPVGTKGLIVGESAGGHWQTGGMYFLRAMILGSSNPLVPELTVAGYKIENSIVSPGSVVVYFPIKSAALRSEKEVSLYEKVALAADLQRYWSDNGVSVTLSFDPETESADVQRVLEMHDSVLKAVSFLPLGNTVYPQQPYTQISSFEYEEYVSRLKKVDMSVLYNGGIEATGESGCSTDICEVKQFKA